MPLDAVVTTGLAAELGEALAGARIDRVQQPGRDTLLLGVYTRLGSRRLLISAAGSGARAHFTEEKYENPERPPALVVPSPAVRRRGEPALNNRHARVPVGSDKLGLIRGPYIRNHRLAVPP